MTIAGLVLALLLIFAVLTYNSLTGLSRLADNAWADIDVQLKRRHDLIPQVVSVVKGHAAYERGTLEAVVNARAGAQSATSPAARSAAEEPVASGLNRIFALAEAYPELRAMESFRGLQTTLSDIEDHLQNARRYYNAVVRDLNTKIQQFPSNLLAGPMGFRPREFFGLDDRAEASVPPVALLVFLGLLVAGPASAQRTLTIERFDAVIHVNKDATLDVDEAIGVHFNGKWNGIYRTIPVEYRNPQGFNWTLGLELVSATDGSGQQLRVESSRERHYIKYKIWVPGAENTSRAILLRYRATNGLRFFEDHDELYWNATGDEWDVPLGAATARVELPAGAEGVRAAAFTGVYGSTSRDARVETTGTSIAFSMQRPLEFHEGLTLVVGWNKGLVTEPSKADRAFGFLKSNWPLAIPIPVFVIAFLAWRSRGRDPRRRPITVLYEPPKDMTPAESGTLLDNSVDMRDITATLVDLAVRGYLKFEEREDSKLFGLIKNQEYVLNLLKDESQWGDLAPHERRVLDGVFTGRGDQVTLSELHNEFYTEIPRIRDTVFNQLLTKQFYRSRPDKVMGAWVGGGIFLGFLIAMGGGVISAGLSLTPVPFVVAGVLTGIILMGFGSVMPARTEAGARALEQVLGFEEFLRRVDSEKFAHLVKTPEMFDRFLPYAMAFGVEKQWARAFEGIYREPPRWYVGSNYGTFSASNFSSRLSSFTSTVGNTMASSPRSSSGSGFGGGGSSGGGGGGGGGGGF